MSFKVNRNDWILVFAFWLLLVSAAIADVTTPASINWTIVIAAAITALPLTIAQVATLMVSIKNLQKTELIHTATNSMKDALVKATKEEATLAGHAAGVSDEKARRIASNAAFEQGRKEGVLDEKDDALDHAASSKAKPRPKRGKRREE